MLKIRRVQDLVSQKKRHSVNLEGTLEELVNEFIKQYDPVEKAKRLEIKGKLGFDTGLISKKNKIKRRNSLKAELKHRVYLKHDGVCGHIDEQGDKCSSRRFLEIHHLKPISHGGKDEASNLTLLCAGHHKSLHVRAEIESMK